MLCLVASALLAAASADKPVVTVLYFDNQTPRAELDVLRKGLADMIITDLTAYDGVQVVEREKLEALLSEQKLSHSKNFDPATAVKVGKLVGAQYLLAGSINLQSRELIIDARLIKSDDAKTVASARAKGDQDKIFDIEQELVGKICAAIDAKLADAGARRRARVPDLDALLAYSKAIDLSDQGKLDEAQAAMQQVVSKSPTFLLARERREQLLKQFQEYEKRKKDLITGSALRIAELAEAEVKNEPRFASMSRAEADRYLTFRALRGRVLLRTLKQHLSKRDESFRVVLRGHEKPALELMAAYVENTRTLERECEQARAKFQSITSELTPDERKLADDSGFEVPEISHDAFFERAWFVLSGRADDGKSFTVAPKYGALVPAERDAVLKEIEARAAKGPENAATQLWEMKAEALIDDGQLDEGIGAYQKILDAYPTGYRHEWLEERIKELLSGHSHDLRGRDAWANALKGCDDMQMRIGAESLRDFMMRRGVNGLNDMAADLEKACKGKPKTASAFADVYKDFALAAGKAEDCDAFRGWFAKYLENKGSVADMLGYQKNWVPWCELGDVIKQTAWLKATYDEHWDFELDDKLESRLSSDGKVMMLNGRQHGPRYGPKSRAEVFVMKLVADGRGFKCVDASWDKYDGSRLRGQCEVTIKKLASSSGDFDEGAFSAHFVEDSDFGPRKVELTNGDFRLRRN